MVGNLAVNLGIRPSEICEHDGSPLERTLFDWEVLSIVMKQPTSVREKMYWRRFARGRA